MKRATKIEMLKFNFAKEFWAFFFVFSFVKPLLDEIKLIISG